MREKDASASLQLHLFLNLLQQKAAPSLCAPGSRNLDPKNISRQLWLQLYTSPNAGVENLAHPNDTPLIKLELRAWKLSTIVSTTGLWGIGFPTTACSHPHLGP